MCHSRCIQDAPYNLHREMASDTWRLSTPLQMSSPSSPHSFPLHSSHTFATWYEATLANCHMCITQPTRVGSHNRAQVDHIAREDSDSGCPEMSSFALLALPVLGEADRLRATQADDAQVMCFCMCMQQYAASVQQHAQPCTGPGVDASHPFPSGKAKAAGSACCGWVAHSSTKWFLLLGGMFYVFC